MQRQIAAILVTLAIVLAGTGAGSVGAEQNTWLCQYLGRSPWQAGERAPDFAGELSAVSEALPHGLLATLAADNEARAFRLWLYDGDDTYLTVPYGDVAIEPGTTLPTGQIEPDGPPILTYDQGMLKILFVAAGDGAGGPQPLIRVYTWCGAYDLE